MIYSIIIICIILILFILLNHTMVFHPKTRNNVTKSKYTCVEDLWFIKPGNTKLLVCLHGIYSTPTTFEDLAETLTEQGWDIYAPALPGSADDREDVRQLGAWPWEESLIVIRDKINQLPKHYQKYALCGHSQGGSLALNIASEEILDFSSLTVIASPIVLYGNHFLWWENLSIYLSGILSFIIPKGLFLPIKYVGERAAIEKRCDAEGIQIPLMLYTFKRGLKKLRDNLYKIKIPLLLAYCKEDKLVSPTNQKHIKNLVSSEIVEEKLYSIPKEVDPYTQKHQLLNHQSTKDDLFVTIQNFLRKF